MVKLFIDYTEVVLEREQSFSITKINPFFSKDSSYSYDITLSLNNPINAKLFKSINRKDVSINSKNYHASLFVNGRTVLEGTAVVVDVSQNTVTIQLLQGNKESLADIADRYIDNIHIGYCYDFDFLLFKYYDRLNGGGLNYGRVKVPEDDFIIDAHIHETFGEKCAIDTCNYSVLDESKSDPYFVAYDYNSVMDEIENNFKYDIYKSGLIYFCPIHLKDQTLEDDSPLFANNYVYKNGLWEAPDEYMIAPQLRLWYVFEKIFQKLGFNVVDNILKTDDFFKSIIIANANVTHHLCKTLPHWTVKEFIQHIENFCCCHIDIRDNNIYMISKKSFLNSTSELKVLNQYTKVIDKDISDAGNAVVNYSYELEVTDYNLYDVIDKNILEQCVFVECKDFLERDLKYVMNKDGNVIFTINKTWYIKRNNKWHIINYFRDFIDNDTVDKIILAIKPAAVFKTVMDEFFSSMEFLALCSEGVIFDDGTTFHTQQSFNIVSAVENKDKDKKEGLKDMFVTFFNGTSGSNLASIPLVSPADASYNETNYEFSHNERLSLSLQTDSEYTLGYILNSIAKYNSKIEYTFYFIDSNLPDLNQIFIINGKKYIAKEFQQEFKVNMQSSVIKGVFYEYVD